MEFLGDIGIEPKLVIAQIVNFLVLVFVLRLVVYKPMLGIFKKRGELTEKLKRDLTELDKKKNEAEAASRAKVLDAEGRASEIIERARKTVSAFEEHSLEENRRYLDDLFRDTKTRIEAAKRELVSLNREAVAGEARRLVESFFSGTLQRELHERLVKSALENFEEIEPKETDIVFKGPIEVWSVFALDRQAKSRMTRAAQKKFGKRLAVEFREEPGLGAGIQIRWGGYMLDGSLTGRLAELANK